MSFDTLDSGQRETFSTGSVRDMRKGKGRYDLIPPGPLKRVAELYERGAAKYGDRNWEKGQPLSRTLDSLLRHAFNYSAGDRREDHLAAVVFNAFALMQFECMISQGLLPETFDDLPQTYTNSHLAAGELLLRLGDDEPVGGLRDRPVRCDQGDGGATGSVPGRCLPELAEPPF